MKRFFLCLFLVSFDFAQQSFAGGTATATEAFGSCLYLLTQSGFRQVSPEDFEDFVAKADNPFLRKRSYLNIVQNHGKLFALQNGEAGYGITAEGLLISVFRRAGPEYKGLGSLAVEDAIRNGATSLWCMEPLQHYYEDFGFIYVTAKLMTSENGGYDYEWPNGRPLMVRMELKPKN